MNDEQWRAEMDVRLHIDCERPYEAGARLLTTVACAASRDHSKRESVFRSLCNKALWQRHALDPEDETPITVNPRHVFLEPKSVDRDLVFLNRRIQERMIAGRMAIAFLRRAAPGHGARLPVSIKRLSVNQMAEFVLDDAGQADPHNLEKRIWRPSCPVIHLCASLAVVGQRLQNAGAEQPLDQLILRVDFVEQVSRLAEDFAAQIDKDEKFPMRPEKLIRLLLV